RFSACMATQLDEGGVRYVLEKERGNYLRMLNGEASIFLQLVKTIMSAETGPIGTNDVDKFIDVVNNQDDFALIIERIFPSSPNPALKALLIHELNNLITRIKLAHS